MNFIHDCIHNLGSYLVRWVFQENFDILNYSTLVYFPTIALGGNKHIKLQPGVHSLLPFKACANTFHLRSCVRERLERYGLISCHIKAPICLGAPIHSTASCIAESCRDSASFHAVYFIETASLVRNRRTGSIDLVHLMRLRLKRLTLSNLRNIITMVLPVLNLSHNCRVQPKFLSDRRQWCQFHLSTESLLGMEKITDVLGFGT